MNIVLFGKSGILGSYFFKLLAGYDELELFAYDKESLDITDLQSVKTVFEKVKPFFVINCAAYTAVDDCETNLDTALLVNSSAVGEIAKLCNEYGSILIHFSTDYVFDGQNSSGYSENSAPSPINAYGRSKLEGEKNVISTLPNHYIVRTSWLYGENGKNFVDTMLKLAEEKDELNVVNDQFGAPTYAKDLAEAVLENFVEPYLKNADTHERWLDVKKDVFKECPAFGIYHLTNSGSCSWHEFALGIFEASGKNIKVNPVSSDEFKRPAKRPSYSILLNEKLPHLKSWQDGLKNYLKLKS